MYYLISILVLLLYVLIVVLLIPVLCIIGIDLLVNYVIYAKLILSIATLYVIWHSLLKTLIICTVITLSVIRTLIVPITKSLWIFLRNVVTLWLDLTAKVLARLLHLRLLLLYILLILTWKALLVTWHLTKLVGVLRNGYRLNFLCWRWSYNLLIIVRLLNLFIVLLGDITGQLLITLILLVDIILWRLARILHSSIYIIS